MKEPGDDYFVCHCPDWRKNGVDGWHHLVPIGCIPSDTPFWVREIDRQFGEAN